MSLRCKNAKRSSEAILTRFLISPDSQPKVEGLATVADEVGHGRRSCAVPAGFVDERVHAALRDGSRVLSRAVPMALARGLPLPLLWRASPLALRAWVAGVLPVSCLSASDPPDRGHAVCQQQAAAAHLDAGDALVDLDQDQPGGVGADAPPGGELQDRLADQAQDLAGHDRA